MSQMNKLPTKTFQKDGRWVNKPQRTEILMCSCGNKYIKTRVNQKLCIKCMSRGVTE